MLSKYWDWDSFHDWFTRESPPKNDPEIFTPDFPSDPPSRFNAWVPPEGSARPETVLAEAERLVYGDRERSYSHPKKDFTRIATFWSAYFQAKGHDVTLTPPDVAKLMILLKLSRLLQDEYHRDSAVDLAGYACTLDRVETE